MGNHKKYTIQTDTAPKRKKGALIFILCSAIFSIGLLVWLGLNDWNVQKSYDRVAQLVNGKERDPDPNNRVESDEKTEDDDQEELDEEAEEEDLLEATKYIEGQELPEEPTFIDGILIANKQYPLPSTFEPGEDATAREAFNELAAAASLDGYQLTAFSTYRAFDRQVELYEGYVERDGVEEADRYSARPGYSEHQTGLAFDIGEINQEQHWANGSFADTEAGKWLADNAHTYGFIMRYPEGKEQVTGYMYESWHFRYVGKEIAKEIYEANGTLEEYLGIR